MADAAMNNSGSTEMIEAITVSEPGNRWNPVVGEETLDLLDHLKLPEASRQRLCEEALSILARCVPPGDPAGQETGLAIGYVQSGKTMSFTTVTALARDNGYAVIILIAGTSIPLLEQSTRRLGVDLRLQTRDDRSWLPVSSREISKASVRNALRDTVAEWHEADVHGLERRTILITAMKHHGHLRKLIKALAPLELQGLPTLIIDDEADQASLNTLVLKSDESTTYRRIKELRAALPHHTYLQYTATPQAPLLINIIDTLSPRFAEVLTPGPEYVGGKHFFKEHPELVEIIPEDELPSAGPQDPPESLRRAMRLFFIGVAAGLVKDKGRGNRSMMVHPSQQTAGHSEYYGWVYQVRDTWRLILNADGPEETREELLDEFRQAYDSLANTERDIPSFSQIATVLHRALGKTMIEEINATSGPTPTIPWRDHYAWILVGGQAMDRGFTVEGLTVTYMPRGAGVGNADTVQQRARFFGYKRRYLGYCRVFLERAARRAYERYVEHEEDVRLRLLAHRDSGAPLTEWKRKFFLDGALKPTRDTVLDIAYVRTPGESTWFSMRVPHDSPEAAAANRGVVSQFLDRLNLSINSGSPGRTEHQIHHMATGVPLRLAMEELLTQLQLTHSADSSSFTLLQLLLSEHLEREHDATCVVYEMSRGKTRQRSLNGRGDVLNLFQGAAPSKAKHGLEVGDVYPGDREIATQHSCPVIQIHRLRIKGVDEGITEPYVPTLAVYIPSDTAVSMVMQDQPGQLGDEII